MTTSVIIATCGGPPSLLDMIRSLGMQQGAPPFDVVVADNRGDMDPRPVLHAANGAGLDVQYVDASGRSGKAHAVNAAVRRADGDTLLVLDDDDTVPANYVDVMSLAVRAFRYVGARLDLTELNAPHVAARRAPMQDTQMPTFCGVPFVVGAATGIDRSLFLGLGGYDEALLTQEDVDLGIRVHLAGYPAPALATGTHVNYRYRSTPGEVYAQERAYGRGEVAVWVKHRGFLGPRQARTTLAELTAAARSLTEPGEAGRLVRATRWGALAGRVEGSLRHRVVYL